jgi:hypothetical protein
VTPPRAEDPARARAGLGISGDGLSWAWDLRRGALAGRGISGEELVLVAGSPARLPDRASAKRGISGADRRIARALAGS